MLNILFLQAQSMRESYVLLSESYSNERLLVVGVSGSTVRSERAAERAWTDAVP